MSAFGHGTEIRANFLQTSMYDDLQQFALLGTKNEALACCSRGDNRHDCEVISVFCVVYASECSPYVSRAACLVLLAALIDRRHSSSQSIEN